MASFDYQALRVRLPPCAGNWMTDDGGRTPPVPFFGDPVIDGMDTRSANLTYDDAFAQSVVANNDVDDGPQAFDGLLSTNDVINQERRAFEASVSKDEMLRDIVDVDRMSKSMLEEAAGEAAEYFCDFSMVDDATRGNVDDVINDPIPPPPSTGHCDCDNELDSFHQVESPLNDVTGGVPIMMRRSSTASSVSSAPPPVVEPMLTMTTVTSETTSLPPMFVSNKTPQDMVDLTVAVKAVKNQSTALPVVTTTSGGGGGALISMIPPDMHMCSIGTPPPPQLYVSKQPQAEQTVLYKSDSPNRGVLKDRDGRGFPTVEIANYIGPAEVRVFAATSTGIPHPYYFVQCVEGVGHCHARNDPVNNLPYACTEINVQSSATGAVNSKAIFPRLSVKRFKDKEILSHFAQWEHEKSIVYLKFLAVIKSPLMETQVLQVTSDPIKMNKKADKKSRGPPLPDGPPVLQRTIGQWLSLSGHDEICLFGNNFAQDCRVFFTFFAIDEKCDLAQLQAMKSDDSLSCSLTHLLVRIPQAPISNFPFVPRRLGAKISVSNPTSKFPGSNYCVIEYVRI